MLPVRGRPPFQSRNDIPEMASRELGNGPNALHHNSQKRYRVNFGSPLSAVEHAVLPPTLTKTPADVGLLTPMQKISTRMLF